MTEPFLCQFLAVPVEEKVHLYERGSWGHVTTLSDDLLTQVTRQANTTVTVLTRRVEVCLEKLCCNDVFRQ